MAGELLKIPVTKGKGFVELNTGDLPDHVYKAILIEGAKHYINTKMTKIATAGLEGEELAGARAAAMKQAEANVASMVAGTIRIVGQKASGDGKVSGKVMTEARRIAKALVKEEMKRLKIKVSHVEASEITKAANALIEANPEIVTKAQAAIAAQEAEAAGIKIDVASIAISPTKVKAAEAKKAAGKTTLSATQAGKPAKRKKGETAQANA